MKKNKLIRILIGLFIIVLFNCQNSKHIQIITPFPSSVHNTAIRGFPGAYWNEVFENGILKIKITPQIAIWTEDLEGNFLETHYVTNKMANQNWGTRVEFDENQVYREDALPVWYHRSGYPLSRNNPLPDALTSASPRGYFTLYTDIDNSNQDIFLFLEVNNSYDYTSEDSSSYEGENGQPSVVYRARIEQGFVGTLKMDLFGHSIPPYTTGEVDMGFEDIPTASEILSYIEVILQ